MLVTQIGQHNKIHKRILELAEKRSVVLKRQYLLLRARRQSNKINNEERVT